MSRDALRTTGASGTAMASVKRLSGSIGSGSSPRSVSGVSRACAAAAAPRARAPSACGAGCARTACAWASVARAACSVPGSCVERVAQRAVLRTRAPRASRCRRRRRAAIDVVLRPGGLREHRAGCARAAARPRGGARQQRRRSRAPARSVGPSAAQQRAQVGAAALRARAEVGDQQPQVLARVGVERVQQLVGVDRRSRCRAIGIVAPSGSAGASGSPGAQVDLHVLQRRVRHERRASRPRRRAAACRGRSRSSQDAAPVLQLDAGDLPDLDAGDVDRRRRGPARPRWRSSNSAFDRVRVRRTAMAQPLVGQQVERAHERDDDDRADRPTATWPRARRFTASSPSPLPAGSLERRQRLRRARRRRGRIGGAPCGPRAASAATCSDAAALAAQRADARQAVGATSLRAARRTGSAIA